MNRHPNRCRPGWPSLFAAALLSAWLPGCSSGSGGDALNIILVVLDTVRADRLDCSGAGSAATPKIDALCDRGIRFERASSTSSWTLPAHASMFTGLHPITHGATQEHTRLERPHETLAEILWARGYHTVGVSANPVVSVRSGLSRGFDEFVETWRVRRKTPYPDAAAHPNNRAVAKLLSEIDPDERFFLFVNYIEAHGPYLPPAPYRSAALGPRAASPLLADAARKSPAAYYLDPSSISSDEFSLLGDLYDGEIAYLDDLVGGLMQALEASGRLDDTLVILTSDHGENLGDHGHFRHVFNLYGSNVHVPLLLLLPGDERAGEVVTESVSLVDVFATVLSAAGAPVEAGRGSDLLAPSRAGDRPPVVAEYYYPLQALGLFGSDGVAKHAAELAPHLRRIRSIEREGLRLIWSSDGRSELYNLAEDPGETRNLAGEAWLAERQRRLQAELDAFVAAAGEPPLPDEAAVDAPPVGAFGELDAESEEQLRALGYLPR